MVQTVDSEPLFCLAVNLHQSGLMVIEHGKRGMAVGIPQQSGTIGVESWAGHTVIIELEDIPGLAVSHIYSIYIFVVGQALAAAIHHADVNAAWSQHSRGHPVEHGFARRHLVGELEFAGTTDDAAGCTAVEELQGERPVGTVVSHGIGEEDTVAVYLVQINLILVLQGGDDTVGGAVGTHAFEGEYGYTGLVYGNGFRLAHECPAVIIDPHVEVALLAGLHLHLSGQFLAHLECYRQIVAEGIGTGIGLVVIEIEASEIGGERTVLDRHVELSLGSCGERSFGLDNRLHMVVSKSELGDGGFERHGIMVGGIGTGPSVALVLYQIECCLAHGQRVVHLQIVFIEALVVSNRNRILFGHWFVASVALADAESHLAHKLRSIVGEFHIGPQTEGIVNPGAAALGERHTLIGLQGELGSVVYDGLVSHMVVGRNANHHRQIDVIAVVRSRTTDASPFGVEHGHVEIAVEIASPTPVDMEESVCIHTIADEGMAAQARGIAAQ